MSFYKTFAYSILIGASLIALFFAQPARADCDLGGSLGTRTVGTVYYNTNYQVLQVCQEDNQWHAMGKINCPAGDGCSFDPCDGAPAPGQVCADGSVYAGLSPDGNVSMFTTPADSGQFTWSDGSGSSANTGMESCDGHFGGQASCQTGEANTALLVGLGTSPSPAPYLAARHCDSLIAHGKSDWYLPALDELDVMYDNRVAIGGFNVSGSFPAGAYWSSSVVDSTDARGQDFNSGLEGDLSWIFVLSVRCVRK